MRLLLGPISWRTWAPRAASSSLDDGQCLLDGLLYGLLLLVAIALLGSLPHTSVGADLLGHIVVGA